MNAKYSSWMFVPAILIFMSGAVRTALSAADLEWQDIGRENTGAHCLLINPVKPNIIFAGTKRGVVKTEDSGNSWRRVLNLGGVNKNINQLVFGYNSDTLVYAATDEGIYRSSNSGNNWQRIYKAKGEEGECTSLVVTPHLLIIGTKSGIFISEDAGRSWHKDSGKAGNRAVLNIDYSLKPKNCLYLANLDGIFVSCGSAEAWQRIFVAKVTEGEVEEGEIQDADFPRRISDIRYVKADANNGNILYLATDKGVYKSLDAGKSWELISEFGLLERNIKFLYVSTASEVYALNNSRIFELRRGRWRELSEGLDAGILNYLVVSGDTFFVAGEKGIFKSKPSQPLRANPSLLYTLATHEPGIKQVQEAAVEYAEVGPEKIKKWRGSAAKKAFLPKVSAGLRRDTGDLWHWETGSTTKSDDDVLRKGSDSLGWDVSLSWDLGEVVFNQDQLSIDVRSRLMVELRNDILDEVNKFYYERLRLKMELDNLGIAERKKLQEKELRIQELTASLDALTGGYFSRQIKT